jgi:hypothetical protein
MAQGKVVWIASYPKSGNTWMRLFLQAYLLGNTSVDPNTAQSFAPNENSPAFYRPFFDSNLSRKSDADLASVRVKAQNAASLAHPTGIYLKTHNLFGFHHGTPTISTEASAAAIYIVRNPFDVVVSYAAFRSVSFDTAIDWVLQQDRILPRAPGGSYMIAGSWSENVSSWSSQDSVPCFIVRYEDLLQKPLLAFGNIVSFLGLPADQQRMASAVDATSIKSLRSAEDKHGFNERPEQAQRFFRTGQSGEGLQKLSQHQIERIIDGCAAEMLALGYDLPAF